NWSAGATYSFMHSHLENGFPAISLPVRFLVDTDRNVSADLHIVTPYLLFNHSSGLFARLETPWYMQQNYGYKTAVAGDDFYQVNFFLGYRFPRHYGELTLGFLNLTDQNYHLNPLSLYAELPRERAFSVRLRLNF